VVGRGRRQTSSPPKTSRSSRSASGSSISCRIRTSISATRTSRPRSSAPSGSISRWRWSGAPSRLPTRPARVSSGTSRCSGPSIPTSAGHARRKRQAFFDATPVNGPARSGSSALTGQTSDPAASALARKNWLRLTQLCQRLSQRPTCPSRSAMSHHVPGYTWASCRRFAHSGVKYWSPSGERRATRLGHTIEAWGRQAVLGGVGSQRPRQGLRVDDRHGLHQVFQSPEKLLRYSLSSTKRSYPYESCRSALPRRQRRAHVDLRRQVRGA